jgi:hypothetical protein
LDPSYHYHHQAIQHGVETPPGNPGRVIGWHHFLQNTDHHLMVVVGCAVGGRTDTFSHREAREIPPEEYFPVF